MSWVKSLLGPWSVMQKWAVLVNLLDHAHGSPLLPADLFLPLPKQLVPQTGQGTWLM